MFQAIPSKSLRLRHNERVISLHFRKGLKLSSGVKESRQKGGRLDASDWDHHSFSQFHIAWSSSFTQKRRLFFEKTYATEQP